MNKADIVIIGGGASGLAAAIAAADCGSGRILLLEKLPRVGKKILSTGNGRCNLGNALISEEKLHGSAANRMNIISSFGKVEEYFYSLGLLCVTDGEGRIYPRSNAASSVLDALRLECDRRSVQTVCDFEVTDIQPEKGGFAVIGSERITARKVIIATGGCSAATLGSDGKLLKIAEKLGHKVIAPLPALVPIKTDINAVKALKGLRVTGRAAAVLDGSEIKSESGEIQFGDGVLSGICIFNLSELAARYRERLKITLDLLPDYSFGEVVGVLENAVRCRRECALGDMLTGIFQKRVGEVLLKKVTDKPLTDCCEKLSAAEIKQLAGLIKKWEFDVFGVAGFDKSQVTAGGVSGECLDEKLMSKLHKNMYFCGEAVDVNGDCGGYNLTWAWASGTLVGKAAASDTD